MKKSYSQLNPIIILLHVEIEICLMIQNREIAKTTVFAHFEHNLPPSRFFPNLGNPSNYQSYHPLTSCKKLENQMIKF